MATENASGDQINACLIILGHYFYCAVGASLLHILCYLPFVSQPPTPAAASDGLNLVFGGGLLKCLSARKSIIIKIQSVMQCIFSRKGFGTAAVGLVR
jgi:hypothetical protein